MSFRNSNIFPRKRYIIDANINRFKEGARVLEDLARFILRDQELFIKIRTLRHELILSVICRSSNEDLGGVRLKEDNIHHSLLDLAHANSIRMQEASRVLEEISSKQYKQIRFRSYQIHQEIIDAINNFLNCNKLSGLYLICDLEVNSIEQISNVINNSNISICQIRSKNRNKKRLLEEITCLKKLIHREVILIINDHIEIALAIADGVHLGQSDLPLNIARELSSEKFIIGISCHNVAEAIKAQIAGANYISAGCVFHTDTKKNTTPMTLDTLKNIAEAVNIPVCAIGGINHNNINLLHKHNLNMIACFNSVWAADDPIDSSIKLSNSLRKLKATL